MTGQPSIQGAAGCLADARHEVHGLMAAYDLARTIDGPESADVHDAVWRLMLPRLRPELRRWYQRGAGDNVSGADPLRDHLSQLAAEKL